MAETNWNLLDTTIPARIAAIPQEAEKAQTANMLQAMQMQGLMNQNELAQSQLRTTKRAEEAQNLLGKAYAGLDFSGAGGAGAPAGQSPYAAMKAQVVKSLAGTGRADLIPSELAKIDEMQHKATVNQEVAGKVEKQARDVVDYTWKQYQSEVPKVTDAAGVERWTRAAYKDPLLGPIVSKFKPEEQAVSDALNLINQPGGLNRWIAKHMGMSADKMIDMLKTTTRTTNLNNVSRAQTEDFFGNPVGPAVDTPMGVSPNTTATINAARKNHLENLAQQGWTFDTDRGIAVNARQGISRPISTLMAPVGGGFSAAPVVGGAPAAPSIAASGGGVPGQRQAPAGQPVAGVLGPKPEKPPVEFTKFDNQLSNLVGNLNRFKQEIAKGKTTSAQWAPTGADTAAMNSKYIALLMGMKDMYTLGALTGPDLDLIEKQISNPATWGGFTKSKEAFNAQIDTVEQQLKDASMNLENSYGHKPKATTAAFLRNPVSKVPDVWVRDASGNLVKQQVKQ